jgi:heme oxygenase (biliverdin-producing, ferredoxin)
MQELAALLRQETHTLHRQVESGAFMMAMLRGQLEKPAYVLFLRNLEPIYQALEQGLIRHANAPGVSPILMQPLFRLPSLHRDLAFLHGASWRSALPQLTACSVYVDHLHAIQDRAPERLAAHAYVRYLGDLSGGQMLRQIILQSLKLADSNWGVDFYNFGEPHEVAQWGQNFRSGLNVIGEAGEVSKRALLDEALLAFELHIDLFDDLALSCGLELDQSRHGAEGSNPSVERSGALG